jgi:hypothetical protein
MRFEILHGCETWSLTLKDKLRVYENKELKRILAQEEVTGEKLYNMHYSPNIIRVKKSWMRWMGYAACMSEVRNAYRILVRKSGRSDTDLLFFICTLCYNDSK